MSKPALLALVVAFILAFFGGRMTKQCKEVDLTATEDSIRARVPIMDSLRIADAARTRILDSLNALPTIPQREATALRFVRSIELDRQLDSALTDPL